MAVSGPRIIAIDGPSGIGKSSVLPLVQRCFERFGQDVRIAVNNDVASLGASIRQFANDPELRYPLALTTAAARAFIAVTAQSCLTICDRGLLSTLVFQGASGIPHEYLYALNEPFLDSTTLVLLELPVEQLALRRAARSTVTTDWFKQNVSAEEECRLYASAADFVVGKGRCVIRVTALGTAKDTAEAIACNVRQAMAVEATL